VNAPPLTLIFPCLGFCAKKVKDFSSLSICENAQSIQLRHIVDILYLFRLFKKLRFGIELEAKSLIFIGIVGPHQKLVVDLREARNAAIFDELFNDIFTG